MKKFLYIYLVLIGGLSACGEGDPNDPNTWIDQLDSAEKRKSAIAQLGQFRGKSGEDQAVQGLIKAYSDNRDRYEIIVALSKLGRKEAIPTLISALDYEQFISEKNAGKAAEALGKIGSRDAVPELTKRYKDANNYIKLSIINALGAIKDKSATKTLIEIMLADPSKQDYFLNKRATVALGEIRDPEATSSLIRALFTEGRGGTIYREARMAIASIGRPALPALITAFQRKDVNLEEDAKKGNYEDGVIETKVAVSIGDVGDGSAVPVLLTKLMETKFFMREMICEALAKLDDPTAVEPLLNAMNTGEFNERSAAVKALAYLGDRRAMGPLLECAQKAVLIKSNLKFQGLRWDCALAYSRIGNGEDDLVQYEKIAKEEKDQETRQKMADYKERLMAAKECKADVACWQKKLQDKNARLQDRAVYSLMALKATEAKEALAQAFDTTNLELRGPIIHALWRIGDKSVTPLIKAQIEKESEKKSYADIHVDMYTLIQHLESKK